MFLQATRVKIVLLPRKHAHVWICRALSDTPALVCFTIWLASLLVPRSGNATDNPHDRHPHRTIVQNSVLLLNSKPIHTRATASLRCTALWLFPCIALSHNWAALADVIRSTPSFQPGQPGAPRATMHTLGAACLAKGSNL